MIANSAHDKNQQIYANALRLERIPNSSDTPDSDSDSGTNQRRTKRCLSSRHVFRRGRECFGEAYIMFTGTADQIGGDKSGDRLIT